jgi:hypothetical protein
VEGRPTEVGIADDLNWNAPWVDVHLWIELPFWLLVNDTTLTVELEGHGFPVAVHDNYFELYGAIVTDSRASVIHRGPFRELDDLSERIQQARKDNPQAPLMWRKCKTVLKIVSRCNEDVWRSAMGEGAVSAGTVTHYLRELCRAHIPVINKLVQGYRLATYDYFAFEVSPWDVPSWLIDRGGRSASALLVPYRGWDTKLRIYPRGTFSFKPPIGPTGSPKVLQLIEGEDLQEKISPVATPGEFELLDALNLMERGDYSGAVRRITTAIEVIVEAVVGKEVEKAEGKLKAEKFLNDTKMKFDRRVSKYEALAKRVLSAPLRRQLKATRDLRHEIVHRAYRIGPNERGTIQKAVDMGRWTFNWFENDTIRQTVREKSIASRSLGRDMMYGVFRTAITPEGVIVSAK